MQSGSNRAIAIPSGSISIRIAETVKTGSARVNGEGEGLGSEANVDCFATKRNFRAATWVTFDLKFYGCASTRRTRGSYATALSGIQRLSAIFGSRKCIASTGIALGTSTEVRYTEEVRYLGGSVIGGFTVNSCI